MMRVLIVAVISILIINCQAQAKVTYHSLRCYDCSTAGQANQQDCRDPFTEYTKQKYLTTCTGLRDVCLKKKDMKLGSVVRMCTYEFLAKDCVGDSEGTKFECSYCNTDGCNSAAEYGPMNLLFFSSMFMVILI